MKQFYEGVYFYLVLGGYLTVVVQAALIFQNKQTFVETLEKAYVYPAVSLLVLIAVIHAANSLWRILLRLFDNNEK